MIETYLIPFLYKDLNGNETTIESAEIKKVCKISISSIIGGYINTILATNQNYYIHFYINANKMEYQATIYNESEPIEPTTKQLKKINDHLKSHFKLAFYYYINGYTSKQKQTIYEAIASFMVEYNLDDFNFELESLYRNYYRYATEPLKQFQIKTVASKM